MIKESSTYNVNLPRKKANGVDLKKVNQYNTISDSYFHTHLYKWADKNHCLLPLRLSYEVLEDSELKVKYEVI